MGMHIVNDHKFTPEEIAYLKDRCLDHIIAENAGREFPKKPKKQKEEVLKLDKDIYDHVIGLGLRELQQELRKVHIVPQGDEPELRTLLAAYLQDERDARKREHQTH